MPHHATKPLIICSGGGKNSPESTHLSAFSGRNGANWFNPRSNYLVNAQACFGWLEPLYCVLRRRLPADCPDFICHGNWKKDYPNSVRLEINLLKLWVTQTVSIDLEEERSALLNLSWAWHRRTRLLMNSKCHPDPFTELHLSYRWSVLVLHVTLTKFSADKDDKQRCSGAETEYHKNQGCKWGCCCCLPVHVGNQDTLICCSFFHILINYMALFTILIFSDTKIDQTWFKTLHKLERDSTLDGIKQMAAK